ncbi:dehydrogenase [Actinoplanes sp. ATCC 53533]|uniref:Gfo/Idh/MocA family protein n=1 Tax=Actinoplanes sp. ATCC 53533 TaxID=1288362 RepID=UPI000F78D430|nr:Gfo/Idh/MocA family oxidoreductase [Actinoplanes sp. ATCC 53533]RSM64349.1 dehydrogenase [Actinoplanes sp. ATCC 53533]
MRNDRMGVAVIGAGMAGRSHAAGYRAATTCYESGLPPVDLVAIADLNPGFAEETARRFGYARAESSWQAIAAAPDIDVVSVVVANHLHREVVLGLLAAGKHVLCEKPFAPTVGDAEAMVAAAAAAPHLQAGVGFTFRRSPAIAAVKHRVESGAMGRLRHFNGRYWCDYGSDPNGPMSWRYKGGPGSGALADIGSHLVDLAEFLCGPIASVRGATLSTFVERRALPLTAGVGHAATQLSDVTEPVENEDLVTFSAAFSSGTTATMSASRVAIGLANSLGFDLFGEHAAASYELDRPGQFGYFDRAVTDDTTGYRTVPVGPAHPYVSGGFPMDFPGVGFGQNDLFVFQARAFLEQVAGLDGLPRVPSFAEGLRNLRLLAAVTESARLGGAEVEIR